MKEATGADIGEAASSSAREVSEGEVRGGRRRRSDRMTLVEAVAQELRRSILEGPLKPGDKMESEAELTRRHKVSRTVVREAIAALRADGLVEPKQGVGVFVIDSRPTSLLFAHPPEKEKISKIVEMLELRVAVETEAAALAAERRSPAQEHAIWERLEEIDACIAEGRTTSPADFEFHLACADATNNPRFREFLEIIGENVIPRASLAAALYGDSAPERSTSTYLRQIQEEHRSIADAISLRNAAAARAAMRVHLDSSADRYRALIRARASATSN
ncbi:MAG: FadR family transcriptional regulator [Neomegalonema sp.]|nr:FadR family transcriptional regulator [Neomegalonema sp.]